MILFKELTGRRSSFCAGDNGAARKSYLPLVWFFSSTYPKSCMIFFSIFSLKPYVHFLLKIHFTDWLQKSCLIIPSTRDPVVSVSAQPPRPLWTRETELSLTAKCSQGKEPEKAWLSFPFLPASFPSDLRASRWVRGSTWSRKRAEHRGSLSPLSKLEPYPVHLFHSHFKLVMGKIQLTAEVPPNSNVPAFSLSWRNTFVKASDFKNQNDFKNQKT